MRKASVTQRREPSFDRIEILFFAFVVLVPVAIWNGSYTPTTLKLPIITILAAAALAALCVRAGWDSNWRIPKSALLYAALAALGWKAVAAVYGGCFYAAGGLLLLAGVYCVVFVTIISFVRRPEQIIRLLLAVACGTILVGIIGVFEHYGLRFPGIPDAYSGRVYSTMGNPTFLAAYLVLLFPAQLCLFCVVSKKSHRWMLGAAACLSYLCVIWTYSRGSWAGLALSLLVLPALALTSAGRSLVKERLRVLAVLAACLAALTAFAWLTRPVPNETKAPIEDVRMGVRKSDAIRTALMKAAVEMFRDHPVLGVGLGGYAARQLDYIPTKPTPGGYFMGEDCSHNEPLQIAAEEGLPGLGIYLWTLAAVCGAVVYGFKRARAEGDAAGALMTAGLASGLIAFSGDLMTNVAIRQIHVGVFFWIVVGALAALARKQEQDDRRPKPTPRPVPQRALLLAFAAAAFVVLAYAGIAPFLADIHAAKAAHAMARGDAETWIGENETALKTYPYATIPLYYLGVSYFEGGYYEQALAAFKNYESKYPHANRIDYEIGRAYFRLADYRAAARYAEVAVRRDPTSPTERLSLSAARYMLGDKRGAYAAASQAIALAADPSVAGEYKVPRLKPSPGLPHHLIARELLGAQLYREAASELRLAVDREPSNAAFLTELGATHWKLGEPAKAEQILRTAVRADPKAIDAHGYLGAIYLQAGRKREAADELRRAISLRPDKRRLATFQQMLTEAEQPEDQARPR